MKKQALALVMAALALIWIAGCSSDSNPSSPDGRSQFRPQAPIPPALGDRIWQDLNMDGIQGDTLEEPGMPNIPIYLYTCSDSLIDSTKTDTMGYYSFDELVPGGYYVKFMLPDGYVFSPKDQGDNDSVDSDVDPLTWKTDCITLDSNEVDLTWDAGMYIPEPGCTRSKGYWKNHAGFGPQDDVVTALLPIWIGADSGGKSIAVTDSQIAYDILQQDIYGRPSNGITKLYAQLLAAKLNIADGAASVDIDSALVAADGFLANYDWNDWDSLDRETKQAVLTLQGIFDSYNNGYIGPGYCGDDMDDDHDGDDDDHEGLDDPPDDAPSMK
jgi:SdrD B-like domain